MRSLVVDKIASVALASDIGREVRISPDIPCEEGVLVAAEVLNNKSRYNTLELTSGRMARVKRGDIIVGALGHRKALFGYSGHIPEELHAGDVALEELRHAEGEDPGTGGEVEDPLGLLHHPQELLLPAAVAHPGSTAVLAPLSVAPSPVSCPP